LESIFKRRLEEMSLDTKAIVDAIHMMNVTIGIILFGILIYVPTDKQVRELIELLKEILRKMK
jgi:hypothetical protein